MIPETYYHIKETKKDFEGFLPDKIFTKKKILKLMGNIHAQSLLPTLLLIRKITQLTDCQNVLLSPINLCDGLAADYAERKLHLSCGHDFTEDILSASRNVAQKYEVDLSHIDTVQTLALQIFDLNQKNTRSWKTRAPAFTARCHSSQLWRLYQCTARKRMFLSHSFVNGDYRNLS